MTDYQRQREDDLVDARLQGVDKQLGVITTDVKEIRERLMRLESRVSAGVLLATAMITMAALAAPLLARVVLPQQ